MFKTKQTEKCRHLCAKFQILFFRLKKTFHPEKHFSSKYGFVLQLFDFILNFKTCTGTFGYTLINQGNVF